MRFSYFLAGLKILQPYYNDPDGFHIGAEHDEFYCYPTDKPLSSEDVKKMKSLGWFQPIAPEESYNPDESWSAYT